MAGPSFTSLRLFSRYGRGRSRDRALGCASDWRRLWRIGTAHKNMSGGRDHSGDGGRVWNGGDHAPRRSLEALCVAQERFMREGVAGLLREKNRKPGLPPLPPTLVDRVVALTLTDPPGEATHWTGRAMRRPLVCRCARCSAFGRRTACSRTECGVASCRRIRHLPSWAT
jgi:hypothetical protein